MTVYDYGDPNSTAVLIQPVDEHDLSVIDNEVRELKLLSGKDFRLAAVGIENWNHDLSPWAAPAVFGKDDFGDGAMDTLDAIMKLCTDKRKSYYIGGYSLAGLFALWAAYQTDLFSGVAAASPSIWFPGFSEYMQNNDLKTGRVYLSLGDREEKTRNPVMATVGDRIREAYGLLSERGICSTLEWNTGNHFRDSDLRTAKAFAWILNGET